MKMSDTEENIQPKYSFFLNNERLCDYPCPLKQVPFKILHAASLHYSPRIFVISEMFLLGPSPLSVFVLNERFAAIAPLILYTIQCFNELH